eukprot:315290-Chlamydomonas_euryale.AAC.7
MPGEARPFCRDARMVDASAMHAASATSSGDVFCSSRNSPERSAVTAELAPFPGLSPANVSFPAEARPTSHHAASRICRARVVDAYCGVVNEGRCVCRPWGADG